MGHINVANWNGTGDRPCDWCGHALATEKYIHQGTCATCGRRCEKEEQKFYIQLGYDGESDVKLPPGYKVVVPINLD